MNAASVERRQARHRRGQDRGGLALGVVVTLLLLVWVGTNGYRETLVTTAATYALVALGIYIPFVLAGSLSLAYSAYAAIGGYAVGLISADTGMPLWLAWVAGPVVAAAVAVVLGVATRRLSGFFLAAVTLLFGTAFTSWLDSSTGFTGGAGGLSNFRRLDLLGWVPTHYQLIIGSAVLVCAVAYAVDRLRLSPWGVIIRTTRQAPRAVEAAGVSVAGINLVALALGAAIAALGGALFTYSVGSITPDTFTLNLVFLAIFMPIIGGVGTAWGAAVGAVIAVELTLNFSAVKTSGTLVLSLGVLVIMLVSQRGVIGYLDAARTRIAGMRRAAGAGHG